MLLLLAVSLRGQTCEVTILHGEPIEIPDQDTVVLRIFVSAADEVDLAGFQSICGVHIDFDHQQLSDLTFDIFSPFGDTVRLIGPALPNGTQASALRINHDVTFITGPNVGVPDPPLQSPWTNIVTGWGNQSSYGGTYIPFQGDFQNNMGQGLDRGPVTGIWELRIIDHFLNGLGNINSFGISFCRESGLLCGSCEAEAGSFDNPQDTTFICLGDSFDPHDIYTEGPTDPSEYEEVFVVYNAIGGPVTSGIVPDFSRLRAGIYQVRSVNIIRSQLDSLTRNSFNLASENLSTLERLNDQVGGQLCMDLSGNLAIVQIREPFTDTQFADLCVGESIQFAGQTISTSGVFMDTIGVRCDTIRVMNVTASDLEVSFDDAQISGCAVGNTVLTPTIIGGLGTITYEWSSLGNPGFTSTDDQITVNTADTWTVRIADDLCDTTLTIITRETVVDDQSVDLCPGENLQFLGQTITSTGIFMDTIGNCDTIMIRRVTASDLQASFDNPTISTDCTTGNALIIPNVTGGAGSITYEWMQGSDPAIISTADRLAIASADTWSVRISDDICDTTLVIESLVAGSGFTANLVASSNELNCGIASSELLLTTNFNPDSIIWSLEGAVISRDTNAVTVQDTGIYNAQIFGTGGCEINQSIRILENFSQPDAQVIAPNITCANGGIIATYVSNDPIMFSTWLDSSGDTLITGPELPINNAGTFELRLIGDNSCDTSIVFSVTSDDVLPTVTDVPDGDFTLDCAMSELVVTPIIDASEVAEEFWIFGVSDTMRGSTSITITEANTYRYVALGVNGCKTERRLDVLVDTIRPSLDVSLDIELDSITCANSEAEVLYIDLPPDFMVSYDGSNIIGRTDSSAIVDRPSFVDITLVDTRNSCSSEATVEVILEDGAPNVVISADSIITCQRPEAEIEVTFPGFIPADFFWTSPSGERIDQQSLVVRDTGVYVFEATGSNGCVFTASQRITRDEAAPMFTIPDQYTITCALDSLVLVIDDLSPTDSVVWIIGQDTISSPSLSMQTDQTSLEIIVIAENGCPAGQVIDILYDTLPPVFELQADTLTCSQTLVEIRTSVELDDHSFLWGGPGVAGETTSFIEVSMPGAYGLSATNMANGCADLQTIDVIENLTEPVFSALPVDVITCNRSSVNVSVQTDAESDVLWETSDGRLVEGPKVLASARGFQRFTITGTNGCNVVDSVEVFSDIEKPRVNVQEEYEISCTVDTIEVIPDYIDVAENSIWFFSDGSRTLGPTQIITDDRLESLTVIGENGCQTEVLFNVTLANDIPVAVINDSDTLSCGGQSIDLSTSPTVSSSHQIFWFREDQPVSSDVETIEATTTGNYILQVIDTLSGCESSDTSFIRISSSPITNLMLEKGDESCDGENDGFISVSQINGGEGNVILTVDGSPVDIGDRIVLDPGIYEVMVEDDFGCNLSNDIEIEMGEFIDLDVGPDITTERGDKINVVASISGSPFTDITWIGNQGTNETGVDSLCFIPSVDETIVVTVTTENGCIAVDSFNINVFVDVSRISAFVPNILNLGSAVGNDVITIDLPFDIVELRDFSIFDRWGQQVAYAPLISSGTPIIIWDGRMNGSAVESGVYVFTYEMLTIYDERRRNRTGDITVIK